MEKSLLLVDDESSILRSLKRIFHRNGYKVTTANSPEEALQIVKNTFFPVIVSDYRMPHKTGGELLIEIKKIHPETMGLILSGYADLESVISALNSGAVHKFLEKPWNETQLIETVEQAFNDCTKTQAESQKEHEQLSTQIIIDQKGTVLENIVGAESFFQYGSTQIIGTQLTTLLPFLSILDQQKLCLSDKVKSELVDPITERVLRISSTPSAYQRWDVELSLSAPVQGMLTQKELNAGSVSIKKTFMNGISRTLRDQKPISLIYLDIRHFRHFNDSFGYQKSDQLLQHIASILIEKSPADSGFAPMNGAAFLFAVPRILSEQSALDLIDSITSPFRQLIKFDNREVMLTFSAGFSVANNGGRNAETLIREAQIAANYSKEKGFNCYPQYQAKMDRRQDDMISLQSELCNALKREEFSLYYQPKISLKTGDILGAEALIRWQHSERGMISPDRFIPLAELTGLIGPIGDWVLSTASLQCSCWQKEGMPKFIMSVNVSGRQLTENDLVAKVKRVIEQSDLSAEYLELEVTETFLMQDIEHSIDVLKEIQCLGVKIAIDDFGTGYSSLNYLTRLPVDTLKVDRSFVSELSGASEKKSLIKNMITMSHDLGLRVVAEGVETIEQLNLLQQMNCDEVQGYYFSPPITAENFSKLLQQGSMGGLTNFSDVKVQ
jgi:diguanylate cyclase (GGDEF)-like protein